MIQRFTKKQPNTDRAETVTVTVTVFFTKLHQCYFNEWNSEYAADCATA